MIKTLVEIKNKIEELKVKSLKTKRTGDYRIGLSKAIDVINLEIHEITELIKTTPKIEEEIIDNIYTLNLQNLTEKNSFDKAYKQGISDAVYELIDTNLVKKNNDYNDGYKDGILSRPC